MRPPCPKCGRRVRRPVGAALSGLCGSCALIHTSTCRHCGERGNYRRGLCRTCHEDQDIRAQYAPRSKSRHDPEPTEAELEAIIAEQRQTMPWGWADAVEVKPKLLRASLFGRAAVPVLPAKRWVMRKSERRH